MGGTETSGGANNAGAMGIYDPSYNYGGGFDYSALGKALGGGISKFGQSYAQGSAAGYSSPAPLYQGSQSSGYSSPAVGSAGLIPSPQNDVLIALARLLQQGGL